MLHALHNTSPSGRVGDEFTTSNFSALIEDIFDAGFFFDPRSILVYTTESGARTDSVQSKSPCFIEKYTSSTLMLGIENYFCVYFSISL